MNWRSISRVKFFGNPLRFAVSVVPWGTSSSRASPRALTLTAPPRTFQRLGAAPGMASFKSSWKISLRPGAKSIFSTWASGVPLAAAPVGEGPGVVAAGPGVAASPAAGSRRAMA